MNLYQTNTLTDTLRKLIFVCFMAGVTSSGAALAAAPYPQSTLLSGINWSFSGMINLAEGSDLWPVTWGADGNIYTSFGDGGGFGGSDDVGRVSKGVSRISGPPTNFTTANINGGVNSENTPTWDCGQCAKGASIIAVNNNLYSWTNLQGDPRLYQIAESTDNGKTWQLETSWSFVASEFGEIGFLNFGKNNAGARDNFIYMYGKRYNLDISTQLILARVPNNALRDRTQYQFYAGLDANNNPTWVSDIASQQFVFIDPAGISIPAVMYNPGLQRYILTVAHGKENVAGSINKLGVFDSVNPWGPWTTVEYNESWLGGPNISDGTWLLFNIPTKTPNWLSTDGQTFHLVFSGTGAAFEGSINLDSFNLIKGQFVLQGNAPPPPPQPTSPPSVPTGLNVIVN